MHPPPTPKEPRPTYFLVRTTGVVVPLIAVDELPPGLDLANVPRSIELEDTVGMLNLGLQKWSGGFYAISERALTVAEKEDTIVKTFDQFPESQKLAPDGATDTTIAEPSNQTAQTDLSQDAPPAATPLLSTHQDQVHEHDSTKTQSHSAQTPIHTHPNSHNHNPSQPTTPTQLCRHWCHHGICKWGQHCRYRHSMPMTLSLLQEVGLADWPSWYRELNPGYFVSETMTAARQNRGNRRVRGGEDMSVQHGHGATCFGNHNNSRDHQMPSSGAYGPGGKAERLRTGNRVVVKDRTTGRVMRGEELGEQIIARLKNMEKAASAKTRADKEKEKAEANIAMERAQASNTRRWEDESESDVAVDGDEGPDGKITMPMGVEGKLVEV